MDKCTYCKSSPSNFKYKTIDVFGQHWEIHQCCNCHAFYLAPNPSPNQLAQAYADDYYGEQEEKFSFPLVEKILDYFRGGRARKLSKYIEANSAVLDIGCGNGQFLESLVKHGDYKLFGTELAGKSAERAKRIPQVNLRIGFLEEVVFDKESFDAITLFHVFEHLSEPELSLNIIHEILKPNGVLVMSFPNIDSWQSRIFKGKWLHLDPPRHLFFFEPKTFRGLMESQGFAFIDESYFSMEQNPFGMVQSILNLWNKKREVLFESMKGNHTYTQEYSSFNIILQKMFFILSFPIFIISDVIASLFKKSATVEFVFRKK
ncbi:class I SAM-dependent methyltransferase [Lentimicrobium sp. S6]|uniref:class I SAM-dependent methyltransferase n=1 Tax=Lentimicrobium sp. S6 TaxID=2735872 RepID=UPI001551A0FC|nr:class I SAM-dependent methyltransferase [Lentimicrobium sp. S6]NPD47438.1 class I SAM-dependent methyltransferase [Lentimicrobium sp. S6]